MFLCHPTVLLEYVLAACYRKMLKRLKDPFSNPYFQFLHDFKNSSCFPRFATTATPEPKHKHLIYDEAFFCDILPKLLPLLEKKFPQLEQASASPNRDDPITAYNKDTYMEYHQVLVELLRSFKKSLVELNGLKDAYIEMKVPMDSNHVTSFNKSMRCALVFGDTLQVMTGSHVIKMHLKIITTAYNKPYHAMVDMDREMEQDEELYQIGNKPLWQACCEWLKLMVAHFDSVCILFIHVDRIKFCDNSSKAYCQVIIKVINPPYLEKKSLPWKDLLENERYFDDGVMGSPSTSEIIMFLEQWKSRND